MTPEEMALLDDIHADPRADSRRLFYADWLEDHGQPEYADFIRLQCSDTAHRCYAVPSEAREALLSRRPVKHLRSRWEMRKEYETSELRKATGQDNRQSAPQRLLDPIRANEWAGSFGNAPVDGFSLWCFSSGLPIAVSLAIFQDVQQLDPVDSWLQAHPRLRLGITWRVDAPIAPLLEHRIIVRVNDLRLDDGLVLPCRPGDGVIEQLARSPQAQRLERIVVDSLTIENDRLCQDRSLAVCPFSRWKAVTNGCR